jgi:hypothetical protein
MNFIRKLFSASNEVSMMRFMAVSALFTAIILTASTFLLFVFTGKIMPEVLSLVSVFLGCAFAGKATQSFAENRKPDETQEPKE